MLRVDHDLYAEVVAHLAAAAPLEGVGLLAVVDEGETARATRFYPGTNVDASPTRYTMDPAEVLAAFRDIDANGSARGWRFGAIAHSHPATPPVPSPTDRREAFYADALLVIVGLASRPPETRVWRVESPAAAAGWDIGGSATVVEIPLVVERRSLAIGGRGRWHPETEDAMIVTGPRTPDPRGC